MLPDQNVSITVTSNTRKRYRELLDMPNLNVGDVIDVPVQYLSPGSHRRIRLICDYCGAEYFKDYSERVIALKECSILKDACKKCAPLKTIESNQLKYGVNASAQRDDVKESIRKTCLNKYGVNNPMKVPEICNKAVETSIDRYGEDYYRRKILDSMTLAEQLFGQRSYFINNVLAREKRRLTCLERYGAESVLASQVIHDKILRSFGKSSKPQRLMYESLKDLGYDVHEDYACNGYWYDCAVFIGDHKLDIEYDGRYWHSLCLEKDRIRNEKTIADGWKVIRFRGNTAIPSIDQLNTAINIAITENQPLQVIELAG